MIAGMSTKQWKEHLAWLNICHAIMAGDTKLAAKFDMNVSKAMDSYTKSQNLFRKNGWKLTYNSEKRGFSATRA